MTDDTTRQAVFRRLPLRAQLAFLASTRNNSELAEDTEYLAGLERIHQECLSQASPEQLAQYKKFS
ncbi:MAG: hypothetical protein H7Y37_01575 [Anaerolineae bacterium]|nr:hypothetical protein [Gloeobacterales cyanobacterium ES-bin-313]